MGKPLPYIDPMFPSPAEYDCFVDYLISGYSTVCLQAFNALREESSDEEIQEEGFTSEPELNSPARP